MIKKIILLAGVVLVSGCSLVESKQEEPKQWKPVSNAESVTDSAYKTDTKKIYYNGVRNQRSAIDIAPANNFYLGSVKGLRTNKPSNFQTIDSFKKERMETLRMLCKKNSLLLNNDKTPPSCSISHNEKIRLNSVFFEVGSSVIKPSFFERLNDVADLLIKNKSSRVLIVGFTDNKGPLKINEALSKSRSASVSNYLVGQGVSPSQITIEGRAKKDYLLSNKNEDGQLINRRAEIIFQFNDSAETKTLGSD